VTGFRYAVDVRYFEADQQGVVFNMWYLAWFEDARNALLHHAGFSLHDLLASGHDIQVVHTEIDWQGPVRWPDHVEIATTIGTLGRTSIAFDFEVWRNGESVATGRTVYVIVDLEASGKRPIPQALRDALLPHTTPSAGQPLSTTRNGRPTVSTPEALTAASTDPGQRPTLPWGLDTAEERDFRSPSDLLLGDGTAARVGQVMRRWDPDGDRAFLVCDASLPALNLAQPVEQAMCDAGYAVHRFDGVTGEPELGTTRAAVAAARMHEATIVVGLGGGSTMDIAKVAAALLTNDVDVSDVVGVDRIADPPVPLVLVPTTAGTGAEATRIAMLSEAGEKQIVNSTLLLPVAAVLDPLLISSLPASVTAATGLDAITHAAESLLSTAASTLTVRMSLNALSLLAPSLIRAFEDGDDREARRGTLYGAYLAGLSLNAGVVLGHSIAYTIANRIKLPHGITTAMALPYCLAYAARGAPSQLDQIAAAAVGTEAGWTELFDWVRRLNGLLGVPPSLQALDLDLSAAREMARECLDNYPRPTNPVPMTLEGLDVLYEHLWRGDVTGYVGTVAA
jgi:YbgC/YbaW family acyl-CoA thioester hydrolase